MTIPASAIVNITPGVIGVGGAALDLLGLFLTTSTRVPVGSVQRFTAQAQVAAFFGATSTEANLAAIYFAGYDNSSLKPSAMLFVQYASAAVAGYLRSAPLSVTIAQLQALSGALTLTINGTTVTSGTISFSGVTSFSNAAAAIQAAFSSPNFAVAYDSVLKAFTFTNTATGAASTVDYASGTLAGPLSLTKATGAVLSQGAAQSVPGNAMDTAIAISANFASFTTTFQPSQADMLAFSAWASGQTSRFIYFAWEASTTAVTSPDTSSLGYQVRQANYGGTVNLYDPNNPALLAAFAMGSIASLDFSRTNGRATLAFRSNSTGLFAGVTSLPIAQALQANGYNFYGGYATANAPFNFFYPGQVSGPFAWIDSMADEIWLNAGLQLALIQLLTTEGSIPYNAEGYAMVEAALQPQIDTAVAYGAIRPGVDLSSQQAAQIKALVGTDASGPLYQRGWYVKIMPATPAVRAARGPIQGYVLYCDGQSIQAINVNSIQVA
jgi:hypothetical protein